MKEQWMLHIKKMSNMVV